MIRILKILLIIPVLYIVVIPAYLSYKISNEPCRGVIVKIRDSADYKFVTRREILNIINIKGNKIFGKQVRSLPTTDIENRLAEVRDLRIAEVYTTVDGILHIDADQRNPVMRVIPNGGGDFYVDEEGVVFRRRGLYSPRLQIIVGNINITSDMLNGASVLDTAGKSVLHDIYYLVEYINNDSFWAAQVDQISVDGDKELDIIPRVGNQIVHMGSADNYEQKLANLEAFYKDVMPEVGWRKYSAINLEYKDQIVCKKR
jgi:cell division protein FtsQ